MKDFRALDDFGVIYSRAHCRLDFASALQDSEEEDYVVQEGTKIIGQGAFITLSKLKEVRLPNSVAVIEKSAFCGCSSLKVVDLSEAVEVIEEGAFADCVGIETLTLPAKLKSVGVGAFARCRCRLLSLSPEFEVYDDCLFAKGRTRLIYCPSDKSSLNLPDNVAQIDTNVLEACEGIWKSLPEGVGEKKFLRLAKDAERAGDVAGFEQIKNVIAELIPTLLKLFRPLCAALQDNYYLEEFETNKSVAAQFEDEFERIFGRAVEEKVCCLRLVRLYCAVCNEIKYCKPVMVADNGPFLLQGKFSERQIRVLANILAREDVPDDFQPQTLDTYTFIDSADIEKFVYLCTGEGPEGQVLLASGERLHWRDEWLTLKYLLRKLLEKPASQQKSLIKRAPRIEILSREVYECMLSRLTYEGRQSYPKSLNTVRGADVKALEIHPQKKDKAKYLSVLTSYVKGKIYQ